VFQVQTVTLTAPLDAVTASLIIEGNGATLTQSGFTPGTTSQLLYINSTTAEVKISRLRFRGGRATNNGAAIRNDGAKLTLESCIFSDNATSTSGSLGGALYTTGATTVSGCTFYGNASGSAGSSRGGAIHRANGAVLLTGNIFWGNTAVQGSVVYGTVTSGGFNVSDKDDGTNTTTGSGWAFTNGDKKSVALPFSPVTFKPLGGGGAVGIISPLPLSYPTQDFYGAPISPGAAAGAVQGATAAGYLLDYAAQGQGAVELSGGSVDADGIASSSVTLKAEPNGSGVSFARWLVNGMVDSETSAVLNLTMDENKVVRAVFVTAWTVSSAADSGLGTLREALTRAVDEDRIVIQTQTVVLTSPLSPISASIAIEGNGATLTQTGFTEATDSQLLRIASATAEVSISRIHFKGGRALNNGAAIYNTGNLTLKSCVFSDNRTSAASAYGGALYSAGGTATLTISGCTFYGNSAGTTGGRGGALHKASGALTLTGNIFWGNTSNNYTVLSTAGTVPVSGGYNLSDKAGGTGAAASGWAFAGTDAQASSLPFSFISFKPLSGSEALNLIAPLPAGYPSADFYGTAITEPAASGAVQTAAAAGYLLDYAAQGPGTVTVTGGNVDSDGIASPSVTLSAAPSGAGVSFVRWLVNGEAVGETSPALTLAVNQNMTVRAVFVTTWTVSSAASGGTGSLREALTEARDGDRIVLAGQTIVLSSPLPQISGGLTLDGNGATLTQSGFTPSATSQLLYISGATADVRVSRIHFTGGRTTNNGGAVYSAGQLTLESCIFSDNQGTGDYSNGGALYSTGSTAALTISGCTFYGNAGGAAGGMAGAIYKGGGTLTLTGNVFWGNTSNAYPVLFSSGTTPVSGGYNISDKAGGTGAAASGWNFAGTDAQAASLPLSPVNLKPIGGGPAAGVIASLPEHYPTVDFYGAAISAGAAAGAIQGTTAAGYTLDYAAQGPGTVTVTNGTVDPNGIASPSVTLKAEPNGAGISFVRWLVNGMVDGESSNVLALTMDGHKTVRAVFSAVWTVTSSADDGPGSFREAMTESQDGDTIVLAGQTITLATSLSPITKSLVISGNGATLTQSGFTENATSQLLYIYSTTAELSISRIHFKGGRANSYGGAIRNAGKLTLESCIFSDNRTSSASARGGAVYGTGSTTILGCTFFGNAAGTASSSSSEGGAVFQNSGLTLTGNVFWGNTAASLSVVSGTVASGGYNISDKPSGTGNAASGWTFTNGDKTVVSQPFASTSFKPLPDGGAVGIIPTRPQGYPTVDFYGAPIPVNSAAVGAAQTPVNGFALDYAAQGLGTVTLTGGATPDADGLIAGGNSVTLTATPGNGKVLVHWTVNGTVNTEASATLTLTMDGDKIVRAVFGSILTVNTADSGTGSLRDALTSQNDGDKIVLPAGQIITLASALPQITRSIVIDGNGATLTQSGFTPGNTSQLLYINSATAEVRISRLHFKGGRATNYGAAIQSAGATLILESCIFSDNTTSAANGYGGALYVSGSTASVTVSGCTFYGNVGGALMGRAGAVYGAAGTVTLTGNIFWENTALNYPVAYGTISGGYNISDKPDGIGSAATGWTFVAGDAQLTDLSFDGDHRPSSGANLSIMPSSLPAGFPTTYFDGTGRGPNSTPGAMPGN
jgi:hypothetical protein